MTLAGKKEESAKLVPGKDAEAGEAGGEDDSASGPENEQTCGQKCLRFWRCFLGFLLFPVVFILTLVAALVWCLLLPRKCTRHLYARFCSSAHFVFPFLFASMSFGFS